MALVVLSTRGRCLRVIAVNLVGVRFDVQPAIHEEHEQIKFVETAVVLRYE
jgi:hypothetical protein